MEGSIVREEYVFNSLHPSTLEITFKRKSPIYVRAVQCRIHIDKTTLEIVALHSPSDSALQMWMDEQLKKDYVPAQARAVFPFCTIVMMDCRLEEVRKRQSASTFGILIASREVLRVYKDIRAAEKDYIKEDEE